MQWVDTCSPSEYLQEALDTDCSVETGGDAQWDDQSWEYYYDGDVATSGYVGDEETTQRYKAP